MPPSSSPATPFRGREMIQSALRAQDMGTGFNKPGSFWVTIPAWRVMHGGFWTSRCHQEALKTPVQGERVFSLHAHVAALPGRIPAMCWVVASHDALGTQQTRFTQTVKQAKIFHNKSGQKQEMVTEW